MREPTDQELVMISAFLDGELSQPELSAFMRRLESDPNLEEICKRLGATEAALKESYATVLAGASQRSKVNPGALRLTRGDGEREGVTDSTREAGRARTSGRFGGWRGLTLVAGAAASIAAALWVAGLVMPPPIPVDGDQAYATFLRTESPDVVCDTPEKFVAYTIASFGEAIEADFASGVSLIGWRDPSGNYDAESKERRPLLLMASTEKGAKALAIFQSASHPAPVVATDGGLIVHHQTFGDVTVWEVSREADPVVLPLLSLQGRAPGK